MSKGIIVVDVPENDCRGCQCFGAYNKCGAIQRFVDPIVGKTPDWCPIRPAPKKSEIVPLGSMSYVSGWNDCIDEILKGKII